MSNQDKKPGSVNNQPAKSSGDKSGPKDPQWGKLSMKPDIQKSNKIPSYQAPPPPSKPKE